jgi:hypothetical protein
MLRRPAATRLQQSSPGEMWQERRRILHSNAVGPRRCNRTSLGDRNPGCYESGRSLLQQPGKQDGDNWTGMTNHTSRSTSLPAPRTSPAAFVSKYRQEGSRRLRNRHTRRRRRFRYRPDPQSTPKTDLAPRRPTRKNQIPFPRTCRRGSSSVPTYSRLRACSFAKEPSRRTPGPTRPTRHSANAVVAQKPQASTRPAKTILDSVFMASPTRAETSEQCKLR